MGKHESKLNAVILSESPAKSRSLLKNMAQNLPGTEQRRHI